LSASPHSYSPEQVVALAAVFDGYTPEQIAAYVGELTPEERAELDELLPSDAELRAREVEAEGPFVWLLTMFPFAFEEEFSADHRKFWLLYWSVLMRIREQRKYLALGLPIPTEFEIHEDDYNYLLALGRGLGKSATIEPSSVMRGAILSGYTLYVCETQDQAEEHIGNCRDLIENPDSRLAEFYPGMKPGVRNHRVKRKTQWSADLFATESGWICRAKGLNSKLRGIRIGTRRPDDINVDDIDGVNDSIALSLKKLKQLTSSVFPTQARRHTTIKFGQNLITEHSVMNQIIRGKSDALAARTTIGVSNTFERLDFETYVGDDGRTRHRILPSSVPTWKGVNLADAQKFLNDSGLATFLAEYQNSFEHLKEGRVLRNYDDARMVISKTMFAAVFGAPAQGGHFVPDYWWKYVAHDFSRTNTEFHACVAFKMTCSGKNTPLPGKMFLFDAMSFEANTQFDDVALRILRSITPTVPGTSRTWKEFVASHYSRSGLEEYVADTTKLIEARRAALARVLPAKVQPLLAAKNYQKFRGSNEQNKDGLEVYRQAFGLPFQPSNPGKYDGLDWIDHYMQVDRTTRHPFLEDEWLEDEGVWRLGCPGFFVVVEDYREAGPIYTTPEGVEVYAPTPYPKALQPDALRDSDRCRYQFSEWRTVPVVNNDRGEISYGPEKRNDDFGNALQMLFEDNCVQAAPLTKSERVIAHLPEKLQPAAIAEVEDPHERARRLSAQVAQRQVLERQLTRKPSPRNAVAGLRSLAKVKR
jgi:hypothetical protein